MSAPKSADITVKSDGAVAQAPSDLSPSNVTPPEQVRLLRSVKILELVWTDRTLQIGFTELRRNCRCADCTAKRRAGFQIDVADDIDIIGIHPIGTGALQFVFSDNHERGIFPWPYLVSLAPDGPG